MKVDSAVYAMSDDTQLVFFVFSEEVKNAPNVQVRSFDLNSQAKQMQVKERLGDAL